MPIIKGGKIMILGLPQSTFFAFAIWPIIWTGIAIFFYIKFDRFEKKHEKSQAGGDNR